MYIIIDSKLEICDKSFHMTPQGYLMLDAIISRSGPQEYFAHELGVFDNDPNRMIIVDRPAEEVTHPISIASFINMPITDEHPLEGTVGPENVTRLMRGTVIDAEATPSNQVKAKLLVMETKLIKKIKDGKRELSAGYSAEIDFSDDGKSAVQRKIRGNHVAFVDAARCGKECSIFDNKPIPKEEINMAKLKIKGTEYEVTDSLAPAINSLIEDNETLTQGLTASQSELSKATALKDAAEEKLKEMEDEEEDEDEKEKKLQDAVDERLSVLVSASKFIKDYDPTGKSISKIKREVLADALPNLNLTDKDDTYINARFDILCEDGKGSGQKTLNDGLKNQMESEVDINDAVAVARANKIKRAQNAYKSGEK